MSRLTQKQARKILDVIKNATLTDAAFGFPSDSITVKMLHYGAPRTMHPDVFIKNEVQLHHDNYIIEPLKNLLREAGYGIEVTP